MLQIIVIDHQNELQFGLLKSKYHFIDPPAYLHSPEGKETTLKSGHS